MALFLHAIPIFYFTLKNSKQSISSVGGNKGRDIQGIDLSGFSLAKKRQGINPSINNLKPIESVGFSNSPSTIAGESESSVSPIHFLQMSEPPYPPLARQNGLEGKVKVKAMYNTEGEIIQVEIVETSGIRILDESVKKTIINWKLSKGMGGYFEKSFEFKLNN
jgi:TonB family protein